MKKLANILIWLAIFFVSKGLVLANYIYVPTSGNLVVGTTIAVTTATAASIEGTNLGSWRATLSDDNFHWMVGSTATGYNVQLDLDNTVLNGANALTVQTEFDLDATTPSTLVQICDWNSSILVDNATDAQCTGGGWRTLNNRGVGITLVASSGTNNQYMWQVYNGYWPTATPLTNFINSASNNKIRIRYFSGTNTTSQVAIDFLRVMLVVNPVYVASNLVNLGAGGTVGPYTNTTAIFQGTQGASDNFYAGAAGSVGTTAFFYFTFDNIKTYYGMNTILTRAETGCDTTGINYRPVIYNYTTSSWEDLSTGNIACSATDTTNAWAKNNVTIANYINNQEIRIGFYGLGAGSQKIQIDQIYIMIGSSNSDVNSCEISFGTGTAADCSRSRDLDMTGVGSSWNIAAEDESTARTGALAYYPGDTDRDATISEEASAAQIKFWWLNQMVLK